ncbi:MAG: GNAT family N-acetyltransferase [Gammaproteobacteria bacterium]|nr:GNAT family N-acetyltransferase [Gammaproteobacteria bacterium]
MQPTLETQRLILRPFELSDASRLKLLAGDKRIADVTANIPYPYPEGLAETWISSHAEKWSKYEMASFAIIEKKSMILIGCISIMNIKSSEGELGYWIGVESWNHGYGTEACKKIIEFCFNELNLKRVHAHHLSRNPASGKVLAKCGLKHVDSGEAQCGYRHLNESIELYEKINT